MAIIPKPPSSRLKNRYDLITCETIISFTRTGYLLSTNSYREGNCMETMKFHFSSVFYLWGPCSFDMNRDDHFMEDKFYYLLLIWIAVSNRFPSSLRSMVDRLLSHGIAAGPAKLEIFRLLAQNKHYPTVRAISVAWVMPWNLNMASDLPLEWTTDHCVGWALITSRTFRSKLKRMGQIQRYDLSSWYVH